MKLRGKLLRTVAQQREGGDDHPVNPRTLLFDEDAWYALRVGFVTPETLDAPPPAVVGRVKVSRALDGSLDALAEIYHDPAFDVPFVVRFAVGTNGGVTKDGVVENGRLTQVSLTARNADQGMPLARAE